MTAAFAALLLAAGSPARDYQVSSLPNGLTVVLVEDHALPLATVEIGVKNGAMTEPPELNGLSHLYEHMFFKGNKATPNQEAFLRKCRDLGMAYNGTTETERVNYFFTTTSDQLFPSMAQMRDAIRAPLFDPAELKREEQVVLGELDRDESSPFYRFGHLMDRAMWKYPSYKDPGGDRATVATAGVDKMKLIQSRYYVPNNSVLVIAGDLDPQKTLAQIGELFGSWARAPDPFVAHPVVDEPPLERSQVVVLGAAVQTVNLGFEWHGPSASPKSTADELKMTYAADLLGTIVEQPGSRFQKDLVESGACLRADLNWLTQAHVGPISYGLEASAQSKDSVTRCVKAARAELAVLAQPEAFTDLELRDAAVALEVHKAIDRESTTEYAHLLSLVWATTGFEYFDTYLDGIRAVTHADIAAFLRRYVLGEGGAPPPFVFGALLPEALEKKEGLDAPYFEKLLGVTK